MAPADVGNLFHRWRVMIFAQQDSGPPLGSALDTHPQQQRSLVKVKPLWSSSRAAITLPSLLSCQGEPATKKGRSAAGPSASSPPPFGCSSQWSSFSPSQQLHPSSYNEPLYIHTKVESFVQVTVLKREEIAYVGTGRIYVFISKQLWSCSNCFCPNYH